RHRAAGWRATVAVGGDQTSHPSFHCARAKALAIPQRSGQFCNPVASLTPHPAGSATNLQLARNKVYFRRPPFWYVGKARRYTATDKPNQRAEGLRKTEKVL